MECPGTEDRAGCLPDALAYREQAARGRVVPLLGGDPGAERYIPRMRRSLAAVLGGPLLAAALATGCGAGGGTASPTSTPSAPQSAQSDAPRPPAPDDAIETRPGGPRDPAHGDQGAEGPGHKEPPGAFPPPRPEPGTRPAGTADKQGIEETVHAFIRALDAHDGKTVCALLAPGALRRIRLPMRKGGCAASITGSIGFAEPGGQPRWRSTRLVDSDSVVLVRGGDGRFTGTVVHRFAGSREPSIEDDVIYLRHSGGRWLIVQPSSTFYRAIGVGDVPLSALAPPKG